MNNFQKKMRQSQFIIKISTALLLKCFRQKHRQYPEIVSDIFAQTTQYYNFRQNRYFRIRSVKSVYHGSESISYLGPKIWKIVPAKMKETNSLSSFKIMSFLYIHLFFLGLELQIFDLFYTFNFLILNFTCVWLIQISILFLV